ncbi:MAG: TlpA family protein disulfide reductase [Chloroflexi bacterium]|nr:MAG: TlpA family protein disulfide reductase [Chloroflexota bacterium]
MSALETENVAASTGQHSGGAGRRFVALVVLLAMAGLIGLFARGLAKPGQTPGGVAVNTQLGEVEIRSGPARPFELTLFDGTALTLDELRGQVVMVDFWASWCPPCRAEAPSLARVYREYRGKGVEFVGIAIWDTAEGARNYVQQFGVTYPSGLDPKGRLAMDYGVTGIPEKYFISRDGTLVKKFNGPMDEAGLKQVLDELLAE